MIAGMRLLRSGQYETAVVAGADTISEFILSGFQSFQALSSDICKPFDKDRNGLNLGEGAGTIILSSDQNYCEKIKVLGGGISNDANHISGPSRTGKELSFAISQALKDAGLSADEIGFISAHGTATIYNDEMEANLTSHRQYIKKPNAPVDRAGGVDWHSCEPLCSRSGPTYC